MHFTTDCVFYRQFLVTMTFLETFENSEKEQSSDFGGGFLGRGPKKFLQELVIIISSTAIRKHGT